MIQLDEGDRSPEFQSDHADADGRRPFQPTRPADPAETPKGQEPDEPALSVSPPPPPWPRIFPQL
jgi:hypothetical protein